jgi:hypothetical protein
MSASNWHCPLCGVTLTWKDVRVRHLVLVHGWAWPGTWTKRTLMSFWGSVPDHPGRRRH